VSADSIEVIKVKHGLCCIRPQKRISAEISQSFPRPWMVHGVETRDKHDDSRHVLRFITRKHITESYFYLAVSREKHRKQATRVWEELAQNVERWQSDDGSTPPSRCAQATIQISCNAIGRDGIALVWGWRRDKLVGGGWSSSVDGRSGRRNLSSRLSVELLFDGAVHVWSGIST